MSAQSLPEPDPLAWMAAGLCRPDNGLDQALWFPADGPGKIAIEAQAKAICRQCPVMVECRAFARDNREKHGVWGAQNSTDRRNERLGPRRR